MNDNKNTAAQPLDLDKLILTQAAFEEIAASWDGCRYDEAMIDDIGAALRRDFERLARRAPAPVVAHDAPECGMCNDSGIVGFPPDQYEDCPNCHKARASQPEGAIAQPIGQLSPAIGQPEGATGTTGASLQASFDAAIALAGETIDARNAEIAGLRAQLAAKGQGEPVCAMCNDSGIVGFQPDQYEECPDCIKARAAAPASAQPDRGTAQIDERCPCGTHTKKACDFAGSCGRRLPTSQPVAPEAAQADDVLGPQRWSKEAEMMESWAAHAQQEAAPSALVQTLNKPSRIDAYVRQLAMSLWRTHYRETSPKFELLDDTYGVLTQIDNMITGLVLAAPTSDQQAGAVAWEYCPECGSYETHEPSEDSEGQFFCAVCNQEWHLHIDYTDVVRKHLGRRLAAPAAIEQAGAQPVAQAEEWSFSTDEEHYRDPEPSRAAIIQHALAEVEAEEEGAPGFWIGRNVRFVGQIDAGWIIEQLQEQAHDECGEWAETYLENVTKEEKAELESVVNAWAARVDRSNFWTVTATEYITVEQAREIVGTSLAATPVTDQPKQEGQ